MEQEIKIKALPLDDRRCGSPVGRPILADRAVYFPAVGKAAGSPLAEAVFAVPGVASVLVSHDTMTVTRTGAGDWSDAARQIGAAIRAQIRSGAPAIAET